VLKASKSMDHASPAAIMRNAFSSWSVLVIVLVRNDLE
jgi:hypothetical protein